MIARSYRTKTSDRWGDTVSPEGVLDMALRGGARLWKALLDRFDAVAADANRP